MGSRSNFRGLAMELWALTETSLTAPHNQTRMLVMSSPNIYGRGTSMNSALRSVGSIEFGAVAIGRNEGDRLVSCIQSLSHASTIIYVDSGSNDGSLEKARGLGADAIALDLSVPFTAGRARNAGFKRLQRVAPQLQFVQFVDGDCELTPGWTDAAILFLSERPDIAAVCGKLRERYPDRSIYNWLCQQEWNGPIGDISSCAGNVMLRASSLSSIGGYREDVIAAEEDELCVRLRAAHWKIWRLDRWMATHDAAMMHFGQWWKRTMRTGYAFAQGADLHGAPPERHFVSEFRRALAWGIGIPVFCTAAMVVFGPIATLALLAYPLQLLRLTASGSGATRDRARIAFFHVLARFPESLGVLRYLRDRVLKRDPTIIEHK